MKKIAVLASALTFACTSMVLASPVSDFSSDKTLFDIGLINSKLKTSDFGGSLTSDSKNNFDFGITHVIGKSEDNGLALQYKYQRSNHDAYGFNTKGNIQQLNVIKKINNNLNAFIGAARISGEVSGLADLKDSTEFQVGLTGYTKLSDKVTGWATIAGGSNFLSSEIGIGNQMSENAELNLYYRYTKFSDVEIEGVSGYSFKAENKGVGLGVTFKL